MEEAEAEAEAKRLLFWERTLGSNKGLRMAGKKRVNGGLARRGMRG